MSATTTGTGVLDGVPTAFTDGIQINPARLAATLVGPGSMRTVPFDDAGATGDGLLMLAFTLSAANTDITLDTFSLRSFGSGDDAAHYGEIALYDDDGNGTWDGAGIDTLITSAPSFPSDNGTWSPTLSNVTIQPGSPRRFFVVATFNGEAPNGVMFGVALEQIAVASPSVTTVSGVPLGLSITVIIETPLTVTSFSPTMGPKGTELVVEGTGFTSPLVLTIGGVPADGVAVVNSNGTQITGLVSPAGGGINQPIELTISGQAPLLLTETYTYSSLLSNSSSSCAVTLGTAIEWPLALALLLVAAAITRRRVG